MILPDTLAGMGPVRATPVWLGRTRVLVVVGKGGVGTSTVAASSALLAAKGGADVLLVAVDGKPGLGPLLGLQRRVGGMIEAITSAAVFRCGRVTASAAMRAMRSAVSL